MLHSKECGLQDAEYDRLSLMIPQRCTYDSPYIPILLQEHIYDRISTQIKVKFFDDLFEQGYIKLIHYDDVSDVYEMNVIKQTNS